MYKLKKFQIIDNLIKFCFLPYFWSKVMFLNSSGVWRVNWSHLRVFPESTRWKTSLCDVSRSCLQEISQLLWDGFFSEELWPSLQIDFLSVWGIFLSLNRTKPSHLFLHRLTMNRTELAGVTGKTFNQTKPWGYLKKELEMSKGGLKFFFFKIMEIHLLN